MWLWIILYNTIKNYAKLIFIKGLVMDIWKAKRKVNHYINLHAPTYNKWLYAGLTIHRNVMWGCKAAMKLLLLPNFFGECFEGFINQLCFSLLVHLLIHSETSTTVQRQHTSRPALAGRHNRSWDLYTNWDIYDLWEKLRSNCPWCLSLLITSCEVICPRTDTSASLRVLLL